MNSSTSEVLWPTPVGAHDTSLHIGGTQHALCALVATAILTAISAGLFTATISMSGQLSQNVQYVSLLLNQGGYTVSHSATSLIVSW